MLILAFKLFITPLLIGSVTLAGRRWGARTAAAALWLVLNRADVVGTVTEVVDLVVEELVRRAVSRWRRNGAGLRLALAAFWARCALFACWLLAARLRGGLGLAGVLAFIFVAAAMAFATTAATATRAVRVTRLARTTATAAADVRTLAHFRFFRFHQFG